MFASLSLRRLRCRTAQLALALVGLMTIAAQAPAQEFPQDDPKLAFFPPPTPRFGSQALNNSSSVIINGVRRFVAPEELAVHVGEFFYPALGTRLSRKTLSQELAARLKSYIDARLALLDELKARLEALKNADAASRERELRTFAPMQAAALAALERDAERIRDELVRGGLLKSSADWNDERDWHLGDKNLSAVVQPRAEARVVRATAYYQPGLTVEQRGLVRELALQLEEQTRAGPRRPAITDPTWVFFSPATARWHLPPGLSPALKDLFGRFYHDREVLKREMRETINAQDSASEGARTRAFADLAASQAPRILTLERLADEIRQQLATLPPAPPPRLTHLPPALVQLNTVVKDEQRYLTAGLTERMIKSIITSNRLQLSGGPDEIRQSMQEHAAKIDEARKLAETDYRQENVARYAALEQHRAELLRGLDEFAATQIEPDTGKHPDSAQLLRNLDASNNAFDALGRDEVIYKDYRIAMLEPGLSAAQRRLLFNAALAGLAQALPPGERMPQETFR